MKNQSCQALCDGILHVLAGPASTVGKRLRNEVDLADRLGVGRWTLRQATSQLVAQGLLKRRRGSGTFVARLPHAQTDGVPSGASRLSAHAVHPDVLFADDPADDLTTAQTKPGVAVHPRARPWQVALWTDTHLFGGTTGRCQLHAFTESASQVGMVLSLQSTCDENNDQITVEALKDKLRETRWDGHIIAAEWFHLFEQVCGHHDISRQYYWGGQRGEEDEACAIVLDIARFYDRATQLLLDEGCNRLLLVHMDAGDPRPSWLATSLFDNACLMHGVGRDRHEALGVINNIEAMRGLRSLLGGDNRPDGLIVADDTLVPGVDEALDAAGLQPGRDIAAITLSNRGVDLQSSHAWSRLEFDLKLLADLAVDRLTRRLSGLSVPEGSAAVHPVWMPGMTHKLDINDPGFTNQHAANYTNGRQESDSDGS